MRVLLATQVVPYPPDSGPKIKTYNVLRHLAQQHEVHLVSFVRSPEEVGWAEELDRHCASVTTVHLQRSRLRDAAYLGRSLLTGRPFLIERDDANAMRTAIAHLLAHHAFDAVHADQLSMAQFAVDLPLPLRVLDEHNAVWSIVHRLAERTGWGPRRLLAEIEWRKLRRYEVGICRRFDRVTVVSEDDRQALTGADDGALPATVIPIAVDTRELAFTPRAPAARQIVSIATMFYPPNVEGVYWFAREVFPLVQRAVPESHFTIVGSRPPPQITQLDHPGSGITVTGYVADLEPVVRESAVLVVPLHSGSGMRVKILEAFARGMPVVSTTVGVEGIDARPGEHLLVADEPVAFAQAVTRLLCDAGEAARLAQAGRRLVEQCYDWRSVLPALDDIYKATVPVRPDSMPPLRR